MPGTDSGTPSSRRSVTDLPTLPVGDQGSRRPGSIATRLGRYVILDLLGAGGMGIVYSAFDPQLDRRVAIKVLKTDGGSESDRSRLLREAKAMARLAHPNVVSVFDAGDEGGQVYLAMEFVRGSSLRGWLAVGRGWKEIVEIFCQAGQGLLAAHRAGLVHRDFKPDNVLITEAGVAKVADFGLARPGESEAHEAIALVRADSSRRHALRSTAGAIVGTPAYMSPEQYLGLQADARSDQFSFFVALYEALYGQLPFEGETVQVLAANVTSGHRRAQPPDREVPPSIHEILARGLAPRREDRWPSMVEVLTALSIDPEESGRARARARRRRLVGGAVAALVLLVGLAGWQGLVASRAAERARCERPEQELVIALGADARATARQAVLATGVAHAERSFAVFDSTVDEFIERSIAGHAAACDGLAEGTLSADMMALRERCAEFQRDDVLATLDVLVHADRAVVDKLDRIVDHLPKPERCGDLRYLASIVDDAAVGHPRRRAIRADLQRVRAAYHAGRYAQGEQLVTPLVAEVERSDDRALRADVLLEAARNAHARGAYDESERLRLASLVDALAVGDAELAAWAALDMIYDEFSRRGRVADAGRWVAIAEGLIARTGADDLTFELTLSRSGLASVARDYSAALALYDQALDLAERQRRSPRARAAIHNNRGVTLLYLGRFAEALAAHQKGLAELRAAFGDEHPEIPFALQNVGLVHLHAGALTAARVVYREAAIGTERLLGAEHPSLALALQNLATVENEIGALDDAHAHATRARAILSAQAPPSEFLIGYVDATIGDIERRSGDLDGGAARCAAGLAALEPILGAEHPHLMAALVCLGEIALARGKDGEARELLERALRAAGDGFEVTRADRGHVRQALARALAAGGEVARARELADQAIAAYAEAGAEYSDRRHAVEEWRQRITDTPPSSGSPP